MPDERGAAGTLVVAHISDLHFIRKIQSRGGRLRSSVLFARGHDVRRLSALATVLNHLRPDLLVVSGDVTTDGSRGALDAADRYLSGTLAPSHPVALDLPRPWRRKRTAMVPVQLGCARVVVPGNHDRYKAPLFVQRRRPGRFERRVRVPDHGFPYLALVTGRNRRRMWVAALDSTKHGSWSPAQGRLDATHERWIDDQQHLPPASGPVARWSEHDRAWTNGDTAAELPAAAGDPVIVVLHHHPIRSPHLARAESSERRRAVRVADRVHAARARRKEEQLQLENPELVVEFAEAIGASLVLFGHQHEAYRFDGTTAKYFCCPTSGEDSSDGGLLVHHIMADGTTSTSWYGWSSENNVFEPKTQALPMGVP